MIRKQDEVIVIDDDDDDTEGNLVRGVFVKEDQADRFSVWGVSQFRREEIVNLDENNQFAEEGETLGRCKQKNIPRMLFSPKTKGKTQIIEATTG